MQILVDIGHPAHVHFFKNFIWEMQKRNHKVYINTVDKEVSLDLLNKYDFKYEVYGKSSNGLLGHAKLLSKGDLKTYKTQKKYDIDIIVGIGNIFGAHVSKVTKAKSISFTDTEHAKLINYASFPFVSCICTPACYTKYQGKKHVRYNGYHELAYLHPDYFTPNPKVLKEVGLNEDDTYIILRFVSWGASHDIGQHGIRNKIEFVKELEKYGRVLITSEAKLDPELEKYKMKISPEKLHDLLYYATLYIGEGATTASECAMLGTHAIYVNTLSLGYMDEEEEKYDLVYNCTNPESMERDAFEKAIQLLKNPDLKQEGKTKREKLLADKIDVTKFMVDLVVDLVGEHNK